MKNRYLILFKTIFLKEWIHLKRYPFNTISAIVTIYLVFLLFFLGYKFIGGNQPSFSRTTEGFIVGFFIWTYSIAAYSTLSWGIIQEARAGTLEQLYMTPLGYETVAVFTVISNFIWSLVWVIPILVLMMVTTGRFLHFDLITIVPLLILTIASGYGIGFITGGLGLIFKKIQAFFQILQFIFVGFIVAPIDKAPILKILPFSLGTHLIGMNMMDKVPIYKMPVYDILILIGNALFYLITGFLIFRFCEKVAKDRGLLGHY
ncbi:MAG TPA: ABC transporter permease [candidate division WOR-3 bacterium]|uniref:ABC transporter permease n=1 Tax=candidate division WOR-3 bacterium TaxID=2052148 RepID=A0A9C9K016_UNCW3|nr:ABC transporter permease [candidate division WOR-3 bacterium]